MRKAGQSIHIIHPAESPWQIDALEVRDANLLEAMNEGEAINLHKPVSWQRDADEGIQRGINEYRKKLADNPEFRAALQAVRTAELSAKIDAAANPKKKRPCRTSSPHFKK